MDPAELNLALQEIGMLSEPAGVKGDEPKRKAPKAVAINKPARQTNAITSLYRPRTTKRKGKHRKPKSPQQSTTTKPKDPNAGSSEDNSDDEYFYPPNRAEDSEGSSYDEDEDEENGSQFDEYELQLAMRLSTMMGEGGESTESVGEQCKFRANVFARQHVLVQLNEDKGTQRPFTEGHVWEIITTKEYHPRGIKVRLMSGDIGRVQSIFNHENEMNTRQKENINATTIHKTANLNLGGKTNTKTEHDERVDCPVGCGKKVKVAEMDSHVDECLTQQYMADNPNIH